MLVVCRWKNVGPLSGHPDKMFRFPSQSYSRKWVGRSGKKKKKGMRQKKKERKAKSLGRIRRPRCRFGLSESVKAAFFFFFLLRTIDGRPFIFLIFSLLVSNLKRYLIMKM